MILRIYRPIPDRRGWARDKNCRVLSGCYETAGPVCREVYVRDQVGVIEGWSYCTWDGTRPTGVYLYVRVTE